jgi:hypothetical protein
MNMILKYKLTSLLFIISLTFYAQSWQNVPDFTSIGGSVASDTYRNTIGFTFNSNNQPIVAYSRASDKQLTVLNFDGNNWNPIGDLTFLTIDISQIDIEIVSDGSIFIAFTDNNYQQLSLIKFNGASWNYVAQNISDDKALGIDLAKDSNDNIYIAFKDNFNGNKATVKKYDFSNENLITIGSEGFTSTTVEDLKITTNPITNEPFVIFNFDDKAYVHKYDNSSWSQVGGDIFSTLSDTYVRSIYNTDIEFSSNGELYACTSESLYIEGVDYSTAVCYEFENNSWLSTVIGGLNHIKLKGDSIGNVYYSASGFNTTFGEPWGLFFGRFNNGNHEALSSIEPTSHFTGFSEINFDNQNTPYVVYSRLLVVNSHIRKFTNNLSINEFNQNKPSVFPNPSFDFITVTNLSKSSKFELYDILGKLVLIGNTSTNKKIDIRALNKGIYFLKIEELSPLKIIKK